MENNNIAFFFIDKNIPIYVRIIIPISCLLTLFVAFIIYKLLPETTIFTLPYKPPPGVYFYQFSSGPDTIITLKHLSVPFVCFIGGILSGIVSRLTPLRKSVSYLEWGMVSIYLIFAFSIATFLTIKAIGDELMRTGLLSFLSTIIPFAFMALGIWFLSLVGALLLLIIPHVGGFIIVPRPHEFQ